jgi:hypothetical protein
MINQSYNEIRLCVNENKERKKLSLEKLRMRGETLLESRDKFRE